ncbi:hypothetical protein EVAR_9571_1 [Eumeta japonica]|uniref:Reverse transcriptase domain-containing protein n=1 Tax=Eumeta variegata TaxID=151549 RepID=A0A4C1TML6_EUMVA|nr:hypothetical protein EVAR_9571_1 [Eumeta japonica]
MLVFALSGCVSRACLHGDGGVRAFRERAARAGKGAMRKPEVRFKRTKSEESDFPRHNKRDARVIQGCVASPWLFNLFMDSCLYGLKEYECGPRIDWLFVKCLLYAADQVILAALSVRELQEMVTKINDSVKKIGSDHYAYPYASFFCHTSAVVKVDYSTTKMKVGSIRWRYDLCEYVRSVSEG